MVDTVNHKRRRKTLRILLAEDEDIYQQIIKNFAESLGLHITIVGDGKNCILEAGNHYYDIILMDIEMPKKNGLEVTRELRKKGIKIPIIAVTANTWKEDKIRSIQSGMNDFLPKPLSKKNLEKTILYWSKQSIAKS
ncbi:MAG: response regulator [Bacteroidales bacterium]